MVSCNIIPLNLTALFLYWWHSINLHCVCTPCGRNDDSIYNLGKRSICFFHDKLQKETTLGFPARNVRRWFVELCSPVPQQLMSKLQRQKISLINCNVGNKKHITMRILSPPTNLIMQSSRNHLNVQNSQQILQKQLRAREM